MIPYSTTDDDDAEDDSSFEDAADNQSNFSVNTPQEFGFGHRPISPRFSGYASSDAYSLQPTPRASNFNELDLTGMSPALDKVSRMSSPAVKIVWESPRDREEFEIDEKDLSFRDCGKVPVQDGGSDRKEATVNPVMPGAMVMLRLILIMVGRKLSRNPNTYSSILGLFWSLISFKYNVGMPSLVKYSIKIISDAGLGMAMFSLGLFMALQPRIIACGTKMAAISMAFRFVGGPIVMSASSLAIGLRGVRLHAAIVQELSHLCLQESMDCTLIY